MAVGEQADQQALDQPRLAEHAGFDMTTQRRQRFPVGHHLPLKFMNFSTTWSMVNEDGRWRGGNF